MADNQEIHKLIDQAAKQGRTELDLSGKELTSLPPEIAKLTHLTSLILSVNQLTSLPPELAKLTKLTSLNLSHNQLTTLPPELAKLTKLSSLNLSYNQLTSLPPEIGQLTTLTSLELDSNHLDGLPTEFGKLKHLTWLSIVRNKLTVFPAEFRNLTGVRSLFLSDNQLTSVSAEIARMNLHHLDLNRNLIADVSSKIGELRSLNAIHLRGNRLLDVPQGITKLTNLRTLDLGGNQLTRVPTEITKLTNLVDFDLSGNHLSIPPEILVNTRDVKAIFAALEGMVGGQRLNEAKMLVVGDGKVGKSSVVEQLIYGTFNPQKQTTVGVEISDEMKVVESEVQGKGEPVKLNIWDFGGQEIQHSTHQFFLTTRSLYLLVVDARKGNQLENIEYWLKLIESFGGDSPIIIVINQTDQLKGQRPLNLDRKALQEKYTIKDFIETSCETGEGIPALRAAIAREVEQLKHVRDIWPREWIGIKQRLKAMRADYIPVERYYEICSEEKLDDRDLRESLLDILHVLGTVVRFPGDTQVLNPRWVTQGVYGLLTSAQLVKDQGQFDVKDVGKILSGLPNADHYPAHTHERLIKVMRHFELCFEFTDRPGHYLIPRHLHDNELDIQWDDTEALKFQYHYETLPDAIISRFIVRMSQYITRQYYWKNGVFLHSGENRAKIKADLVDRKIFVSITGKEYSRRQFLAVIRSTFEEINRKFKIEIRQMIPVPGFPQVLVSYKDLLALEEMNELEIVIPELKRKFSVRELLDGVEELSTRTERRVKEIGRERSSEQTQPEPRVPIATRGNNNPWLSGLFYLFSYVVLIATILIAIVVLNKYGLSWTAATVIPVVVIAALLGIGVIGANQLKNDERLSDESYVKLMVESYKRLPLLKGSASKNEPEE